MVGFYFVCLFVSRILLYLVMKILQPVEVIFIENFFSGTCPVVQTVKRLPTMRETQVKSLGWEDLLEKEMATHSSILAWKIPWTEEPGRLQSMESQRVRPD